MLGTFPAQYDGNFNVISAGNYNRASATQLAQELTQGFLTFSAALCD